MADPAQAWRELFLHWPPEVERRGVVVTTFEEQVPFVGFATSEQLLLLERTTPDTAGARKIMLGYGQIAAVKFTDVLKLKAFQGAGFTEARPAR
jgi:hypothetical protein